jgi:hypothetical protein
VKRRAVDAAVWRATFREVKVQVANLRKDDFATSNIVNLETGEWVDLHSCDDEEGEGSTGWPPRQWYFAFEILVSSSQSVSLFKSILSCVTVGTIDLNSSRSWIVDV